VTPALDQVGTMLRARYLVTIPTPARLPAPVSLRVDTGHMTLTDDAVVTAPAGPDRSESVTRFLARSGLVVPVSVAVAILAVVFGVLVIRRRRQYR
jgi:hypothetical protein